MSRVLVIDGDRSRCRMLRQMIAAGGHEVEAVHAARDGLGRVRQAGYDAVVLAAELADAAALDALPRFREVPSVPPVIVVGPGGDPDGAERAVRSGAWDYVVESACGREIPLSIMRAVRYRDGRPRHGGASAPVREGLVGDSPCMRALLDQVAHAGRSLANVLVVGETGTGKELVARAIHGNSARAHAPLVVVDCAALPRTLAESILFGHQKGAFTGADRTCHGLVRQAHGGTLFLDEVGELPLALQKAFLRVVETHRYRPLGSQREHSSDFRLIAATNRNLAAMAREGRFREDLLFRLRALTIEVAPLRQHPEDIRPLALHYLRHIAERSGLPPRGVSPDFLEALAAYAWPGNVRELIHSLETAVAGAKDDGVLYAWHLPADIRAHSARNAAEKTCGSGRRRAASGHAPGPPLALREHKHASERGYLEDLLAYTGFDVRKAARVSGISRARLYELIQKHGLSRSS